MNNPNSSSLQMLAVKIREGEAAGVKPAVRADLEERLTPLIRCALRTGAGVPALVQWVRRTLPQLPTGDLEQTAPRMARLLCAELFRRGEHPDTVVGRLFAGATVAGN